MSDPLEQLRLIKYGLLQTTIGPSIACDFLVFAYLIRQWRKEIAMAPQNHVLLCLLIVSFVQKITDLPLSLYLLRWGITFRQTDTFCIIWNWIDDSMLAVSLHLVTCCCIERHLFVFHGRIMKKKWCLILFHYIPMTICLLYAPLFYLCVVGFPAMCTNVWDYTVMFCAGGCYNDDPFWGSFDWLFHYATPTIIISTANLLLFCRIIWQKVQRRQIVQWKRQRRMITQLVFISLLYLIFMSPAVVLGSIEALWSPTFGADIQFNYFYYSFGKTFSCTGIH